jgi:shikimate dehydrogenase
LSGRITAETRIAGVVGHPVRHSLSPVIHNAWISAAGIDAVYLAFEPAPERFEAFVNGLRGRMVLGLNVTIPFKEQALALADLVSPAAERAGAANLLAFRDDGSVEADNTDGQGLLIGLEGAGFRASRGPVVILGAGGAARGAAASLLAAGAPEVRLVNRSLDRAQAIAALDPRIRAHGWERAPAALQGAAAVINATSLGMAGQPPLQLSLEDAPAAAVVMDMVYKPLETELLRQARSRGHQTADGLSMLIGQAAPSFEAFFGQPPPADVDVRGLCEAALAART